MTCCADDTSFLGYICKSAYAPKLKQGEWVEVTAKAAYENRTEYQGEGIVLYAENVSPVSHWQTRWYILTDKGKESCI